MNMKDKNQKMEFLNTFNMYCPNRKLQLYICKVWHTHTRKKKNQKHFKSNQIKKRKTTLARTYGSFII